MKELEKLLQSTGHKKLARLLDVAKAMAFERQLDKLLPFIAKNVADTLDADRCGIFLLDKESQEIWSMVATGEQQEIRFPVGVGIAGQVLKTGKILHIPDAYLDQRFHHAIDLATGYKTRNILAAPLTTMTGEVIGCFEVINKNSGDFDEGDEVFLIAFGSYAAAAIESAQLHRQNQEIIDELLTTHQDLQSKIRQMQVVLATERHLNVAQNMQEFMQLAIENAATACDAAAGSILLLDQDQRQLMFSYQVGDKADSLKQMALSTDEGIAGHVLKTGQAMLENSVATSPLHSKRVDLVLDRRTHSIMAVPLQDEDKTIGVLEVVNSRGGQFSAKDLSFLHVISAQITSMMQRRRLLDEREHSSRLATIGQLSSSILHDLKNPMAAIKGFAEIIKATELTPEERKEYGDIISGQVDRCVGLTKEVLSFARGDRTYHFAEIDAVALFGEIKLILEVETKRLGRNLQMDIIAPPRWIGDSERLKRVIFNLTNNAIEATPAGGTISISCSVEGEWVEIRVADNGRGIAASIRHSLFDAFATANKAEGTGLGLHIARDIVRHHGGDIRLDPTVAQGACLIIRLPVVADPP